MVLRCTRVARQLETLKGSVRNAGEPLEDGVAVAQMILAHRARVRSFLLQPMESGVIGNTDGSGPSIKGSIPFSPASMTFDHKTYNIERYHRRRRANIALLGGKCVRCGTTDDLHFDHIDPATKTIELGKLWSLPQERILQELKLCQLLCGPCHRAKTAAEQSVGHGQGMTGKKNCRCKLCAPLKNAWLREYKRKKRAGEPG